LVKRKEEGKERRKLTSSSLEVLDVGEGAGVDRDLLVVGSESVSWRNEGDEGESLSARGKGREEEKRKPGGRNER